ncbi:hypothetical protein SD70_15215 [Gordoniibacillus kamchatkensis]|uniref:DUF6382 domain-containing protein n=1 Tax=Gordoniibacillus kamchatkensis TaxID=1590651 RepID=A0ABR5AGJ4_9BACL|nr:DUF6382 domain-containing protein [Paenibacillus sp. VKM B-2647]KIL40171.1 hypothetical protein SD70_15215 [Paenibacillus sp. VKM B-2647]
MQQIFGLNYDYEYRNGTNLVLFRDGGIREEELSRIQTKMLQIGQVPRLLPFVAEHVDGHVRLLYDIGSRRMLQQALCSEPLGVLQALQLLITVTATLEECRSFMLRESGFIMRETFLFAGADLTDVAFVYVPITGVETPPIAEELERFIRAVSAYVPAEDRSVLISFAEYCRNGAFRVKELKRKLIEQLTVSSMSERFIDSSNNKPQNETLWSDPLFDLDEKPITGAGDAADASDVHGIADISALPDKADDESSILPAPFRKRLSVLVAAAGVVCCGWLWNRWLEQPSVPLLQISLGATLLALDGWLLVRFAIMHTRWPVKGLKRTTHKEVQTDQPRQMTVRPIPGKRHLHSEWSPASKRRARRNRHPNNEWSTASKRRERRKQYPSGKWLLIRKERSYSQRRLHGQRPLRSYRLPHSKRPLPGRRLRCNKPLPSRYRSRSRIRSIRSNTTPLLPSIRPCCASPPT